MQLEQSPDRLVVKHRARAWWIKFMGYVGAVVLPIAILEGACGVAKHDWHSVPDASLGLLFGGFGVFLLFRAPLELELVADRATRRLRIQRRFSIGADTRELAFSDVKRVSTSGARGANMSVVVCRLETADGKWIDLVDEGGFKAAQADAMRLAQELATTLGVPLAPG